MKCHSIFSGKIEKAISMSSAGIFTQCAKHQFLSQEIVFN